MSNRFVVRPKESELESVASRPLSTTLKNTLFLVGILRRPHPSTRLKQYQERNVCVKDHREFDDDMEQLPDDEQSSCFLSNILAINAKESLDEKSLDDKSIVRRAHELIDLTAERIRIPPAYHQQTALHRTIEISDESFASTAKSEVALAPVAARAKAKAASAYFTGGQKKRENLEPGVEYIRSRAPGLDSSFYLRLMRVHNFRHIIGTNQNEHIDSQEPIEASQDTTPVSPSPQRLDLKEQTTKNCALCERRCSKMSLFCAVISICVLVTSGVAIAVVFGNGGKSHPTNNLPSAANEQTHFSVPFAMDCNTMHLQLQPNVWAQCNCTGNISVLAADIVERYNNLTATFIHTVLPDFNESLQSCSAQNEALVWLASADGATIPSRMRQRYIFAFLFGLWDGPSWSVKDKWLSSGDECDWYGLQCNTQGEVVNINLNSNNALVNLSPIAALLTQIESMDLGYTVLQGNTIPSEVGLLSNLVELTLSASKIKGTLPIELFNLGGTLQFLDISENALSGTIPTLIGKLIRLSEFLPE